MEDEGEKTKEEVHFETINLYWVFYPKLRYEEEPEVKVYVNNYNLTSKGQLASNSAPKIITLP